MSIKVLKEPNTTTVCKKCKAVLKFSWEDVSIRNSLSKHGGSYLSITCPCCKSIIRVWEN